MKILFLLPQNPGGNYIDFMLTQGMYSILGTDFVDYPRYDCLRVQAFNPEPHPYNCWKIVNGEEPDRTDLEQKLKSNYFDAVLVSARAGETALFQLAKEYGNITAEIDGEDVAGYVKELTGTTFKFSRECLQNYTHYLSFCAAKSMIRPIDVAAKDIDVFGYLSATHPVRWNWLHDSTYPHLKLIRDERVMIEDYLKLLSRAKAAVSITGNGWDTIRYWEIPAVGSYLISSTCPHNIPHPLPHVIYVSSKLEMQAGIAKVNLMSLDQLEQDLTENQRCIEEWHTAEARAKYVLEIIKKAAD